MSPTKIGVTNSLFSGHPVLRQTLLERYPDSTFRDDPKRPTEDDVIALLADRDAAIVGMEPITEKVLSALPNLKVIGKMGIGCDTLDFDALRKHQIRFGYTPGTNKLAVAELTLSYMIAALRWVMPLNIAMRNGERPRMKLGKGLTGRVVGIHGCGNVGKEVVRLLQPFNCEIITHDIEDYGAFYREYGVQPVSFDELLERSEVLTLHVPKTAETTGMYTGGVLERMRPDAVLINLCRGGIVDEDALYERLKSGRLPAAAFDVFDIEPATNDKLINLPNMLSSPHIGAATDEARITMGMAAIDGLTENALVRAGQTF